MPILRPWNIWFPAGNRQAVDRLADGNGIETIWTRDDIGILQVTENIGATRRSRTGNLLITKNTNPHSNLSQPEKTQRKQGS